jgi:predicted permease
MKRLRAWGWRLAGLFSKQRRERELADELNGHLEMHIDDNLRAGMAPEQARREALLKLGGLEQAKEAYRDRGTVPFLDNLAQDLRFALRQLVKNPGFSVTAIVVLALGLGASLATFALVDAAVIKPLPYRDPNRLVSVTESSGMFPRSNLSYLDYLDWKRFNTVFQSLEVYSATGYMLGAPSGSVPVHGTRVSDGFFRTLGTAPMLGRDFYAGEDLPGKPNTVILSYGAWQKYFGERKDVIGKTILLSEAPYTVIGVLPRAFQFAPRGNTAVWVPLRASGHCETRRSCHNLWGIARLKDGISISAALAQTKSIAAQLEKQYPDSNRGQGAVVIPLSEAIVGEIRPILLILLGGAGLLLVIATVNVASLLLVRSESRKREMAVRSALGGSKLRLLGQFATEGAVLVIGGCFAGMFLAYWAMRALPNLVPPEMLATMPFLADAGLTWRVLACAAVLSLLAGALFSITPSLRVSLQAIRDGLAEGSRGSAGTTWQRLGANLVVVELAVAVVLLAGAGLLGKSLYRLLHVELGFQPDHLATLYIDMPQTRYTGASKQIALGREVVRRVSNLPGVRSVALTSLLPAYYNSNTDWIRFVGRPYSGEHNEVNERDVSSGYFTTIGAKLLRGRYFTDTEDQSKPKVVVINKALATKYFPGQNPVGQKIGGITLSPDSIKEIIGVVDNIREGSLDSDIWPAVYYPFNQSPDSGFSLVARTKQSPQAMLLTASTAIRKIDPGLGIAEEATMMQRIHDSPSAYLHRSAAWIVGAFAALALLLSVVGLYGVIAYSAGQRTREIGVRMALGAQRHTVYALVLREAARLAAIGICIGLFGAVFAAGLMSGLLFGVRSWDLPTLIGVAVVLGVASVAASYVPARRAASINPIEALRSE